MAKLHKTPPSSNNRAARKRREREVNARRYGCDIDIRRGAPVAGTSIKNSKARDG
jgi:hypothetical protein